MEDTEDLQQGTPSPASARSNDSAMDLLPLWVLLSLGVAALVVMLLVKVYTRLTVGKCTSKADMTGKTVIITGSNTGIGKETARQLALRNARVILACRNQVKAKEAAEDIKRSTGRDVDCMQLDLCSFQSVRAFAEKIISTENRLDVLINNAGMMCESCFGSRGRVHELSQQ